jgi:SAM-dependent methyltransferase
VERTQAQKAKKQGASARTKRTQIEHSPTGAKNLVPVDAVAVFAYLSENPDLAGLLQKYPELTADDLRAYFADARALIQGATTKRVRKGANRTIITRTHGLPAPDPSIHKGNIFRALIALLKPGRMLDLGAGKGNFSLSAAQLGWQVTAVDARTVRWPDAESEADPELAEQIRTIRWVQADVREFPIEEGQYDLICVLGLLHHLEVPDQVSLLKRCSHVPTLLDTRIAKTIVDSEGPYEGMLIREHGKTREERDAVPQASWGNPLSFQHTEESLLLLVLDCGYIKMLLMRPPHRPDYTFYFCLPGSSSRSTERLARREERRARASNGD